MDSDLEEMKADIKALRERLAPERHVRSDSGYSPPRSAMYHGVLFLVLATISISSFLYGKKHDGDPSTIVFIALWLFCGIPALFQLVLMIGTLIRAKNWTTKIH